MTSKTKSGKGSEETIAALTQNMVTALTTKTVEDPDSTRIMVLLSTTTGSRRQSTQQERAISMLEALEIPFETLNCTLPENKERRDNYFELSGIRGDFPQFFLRHGSEETPTFLGQFEDIEGINEKSNWPPESLEKNDKTWDSVMGTTNKYNGKGWCVDDDSDSDLSGGGGIYGDLDDDDEDGGNVYAGL